MTDLKSVKKSNTKTRTNAGKNPAIKVLEFFQTGDIESAIELFHEDAEFHNTMLPTIKGKKRIGQILRLAFKKVLHKFDFHDVQMASNDKLIMVERTDVLYLSRRIHVNAPVIGVITVENGKIVRWSDNFDWLTLVLATAKMGITLPFALLRR